LLDGSLEDCIVRACRRYRVDWSGALHVAGQAERIFRRTRHLHGLTKTFRPVLRAAAMLHNISATPVPGRKRPRPGDLVADLRIPALSQVARRIVVEAVRLHDRAGGGAALAGPIARARRTETQVAGRIAAILRIAAALDRSGTGATKIAVVDDDGRTVTLYVSGGPARERDAAAAAGKTGLWNRLFARPIQVVAKGDAPAPDAALTRPDGTLAEATRRILQRQVEQLISREYGLANRRDIEYVHELRVATRRLRTALRIVGGAFGSAGRLLRDELAWLARALGEVRDCDVFLHFLQGYVEQAGGADRPVLRTLIAAQRRRRTTRYGALLEVFGSRRYAAFRDGFYRLVTRPVGARGGLQPAGLRAGRPVWKQAQRALRRRFARLAEYGRYVDRLEPEQAHRLRIDCKRLRYTAEFFADVYPRRLAGLIDQMVRMQDWLGEVHDTEVWSEWIVQHRSARRGSADRHRSRVLGALIEHLAAVKADCLAHAAADWRRFAAPGGRREVLALLAAPRRK